MSDSKISALPTKAVPISADILPIVDSTVTDNKKITIGSLPISTATQTALNTKMTGNAAITGATKTKITYDTKGLVTSGADATTADISDFNSSSDARVAIGITNHEAAANPHPQYTTNLNSIVNALIFG